MDIMNMKHFDLQEFIEKIDPDDNSVLCSDNPLEVAAYLHKHHKKYYRLILIESENITNYVISDLIEGPIHYDAFLRAKNWGYIENSNFNNAIIAYIFPTEILKNESDLIDLLGDYIGYTIEEIIYKDICLFTIRTSIKSSKLVDALGTPKQINKIKIDDDSGELNMLNEQIISEMVGKSYIKDKKILDLIEQCKKIFDSCGFTIEDDIDYMWGNAVHVFGTMCWPTYKDGNFRLILNEHMIDEPDDAIKNTICHELCHYIVMKEMINRNIVYWRSNTSLRANGMLYDKSLYSSHGRIWKNRASQISKVLGTTISATDTYQTHTGVGEYAKSKNKYIVKCKNCGQEYKYNRKTSFVADPNQKSLYGDHYVYQCGNCHAEGQFEVIVNESLTGTDNSPESNLSVKSWQLNGYTYLEALQEVKRQILNILQYNDINIKITGLAFIGSRIYGEPRPDSDLDVRMTYEGDEREDTVFNALHDEDYPIILNGIIVDINPIKDGDINFYLKKDKAYNKKDSILENNNESNVVYHGTNTLFDKFNMPINWFSTDKEYSEEFAHWLGKDKSYLYSCKLNIKNSIDVGNTSEPMFNLLPLTPPYKLSKASEQICNKLGIDENVFIDLANYTSAGNNVKKQYKLKLHSITRLPQFKDLAQKAGFDSIKAVEANHITYGVFNPDDINIINVENLNENLKEDYPKPKKLYSIKDKKAVWDNDAQDYIWWDSEAEHVDKYGTSYKGKISPKDFLDLTTFEGSDKLVKGDDSSLGELRDLDIDEFNKETRQPIFLIISFENSINKNDFVNKHFEANVVGHEGRHRMFALMQAGVEEVDIQIKVIGKNYNKKSPYEIKTLDLIGQFNQNVKVTIHDPIIMSWEQHKLINPALNK